jgi:chromate reductase, NAD(P)H dehydrogenase (quinone)
MSHPQTIKALGVAGSLRQKSFNKELLAAAGRLAPEGMSLEIFDLAPIPLYNEDVREQGFPPAVEELRKKIAAADCLVIAMPEYNFSIAGVLKNAIDWVSRPPEQPLKDKPVAIMGATVGVWGTIRGQYHLRQVLGCLDAHVLHKPEIMVAQVNTKVDEQGRLKDQMALDLLKTQMAALKAWTLRLKSPVVA